MLRIRLTPFFPPIETGVKVKTSACGFAPNYSTVEADHRWSGAGLVPGREGATLQASAQSRLRLRLRARARARALAVSMVTQDTAMPRHKPKTGRSQHDSHSSRRGADKAVTGSSSVRSGSVATRVL